MRKLILLLMRLPLFVDTLAQTKITVCVEYLHFRSDGTIKPITLTQEGIMK